MSKIIDIKNAKELGNLLKVRRKELKITQTELAKFTGLSHTGIGRIETAQNDVKFSTLLKLSQMLGLKLIIEKED